MRRIIYAATVITGLYVIPLGILLLLTEQGGLIVIGSGIILVGCYLSIPLLFQFYRSLHKHLHKAILFILLAVYMALAASVIVSIKGDENEFGTAQQELDKPLPSYRFRGSFEALSKELLYFDSLGVAIDNTDENPDPDTKKLIAQLKAKLAGIQKSEFPVMRRECSALLDSLYSKEGASVFTDSTGDTILNFVSWDFSDDQVARLRKSFSNIVIPFRFKELRFKKSNDATRYISYKLNTPDEDAPVKLDREAMEIK